MGMNQQTQQQPMMGGPVSGAHSMGGGTMTMAQGKENNIILCKSKVSPILLPRWHGKRAGQHDGRPPGLLLHDGQPGSADARWQSNAEDAGNAAGNFEAPL